MSELVEKLAKAMFSDDLRLMSETGEGEGPWAMYIYRQRANHIIALVEADVAKRLLSDEAVDEASAAIGERLPTEWGDAAIAASIDMAAEGLQAALAAIGIEVPSEQ